MIRNRGRTFTPPTDVVEQDDRLIVLVEIAGMKQETFEITLLNKHLVVSGARGQTAFEQPAYHQAEIGFGDFRLEIRLPHVIERETVRASYEDGFLTIELPYQGEKRINVNNPDKDQG